jgi:hypothetical protein
MKKIDVKGEYFNGKNLKTYDFRGILLLDKQTFTGLINDGRCPAEVIDGHVSDGTWRFIKKYRSDKIILEHPFFKETSFPETSLGQYTADKNQGIVYHGRTTAFRDKKPFVRGLFNSSFVGDNYQLFDNYVRKLARSDFYFGRMSKDSLLELIPKNGGGIVTATNVGPWNMRVKCDDEIPKFLTRIGKKVEYPGPITI